MVLPGRVRQVPPPRNRPKRIVPRLVSVDGCGISPADDCDGCGRFDDFMIRRLRLALHRLDAHFCGRRRNRRIWRRSWLLTVARCNNNDDHRRNQQRSPANRHYLRSIHLASRNPHKAISNSQAYTMNLMQNVPTLSGLFIISPLICHQNQTCKIAEDSVHCSSL